MTPETSENVRPFKWDGPKEEAAKLLAANELNDADIAARVGVTDRQMRRWKQHPDFAGRIRDLAAKAEQAAFNLAIARKAKRLHALNDRWERMQRLMDARAADPAMQDLPGGKEGLLVVKEAEVVMEDVAVNGEVTKKARVVVLKVAADVALLKEMREHEKQGAIEVHQWVEKVAPTNPEGDREYGAGLTDGERSAIIAAVVARFGIPGVVPDAGRPVPADGQVLPGPGPADAGRIPPP